MTHPISHFLIALVCCLSISAHATVPLNQQRFKVAPSPVYQSIRDQSLAETLTHVAQRSGIVFKISTDLANDRVEQSISAANWHEAIQKLLTNLNYTVIEEHGKIKTVIVSGHKNDGINNQTTATGADSESVMVLERKLYQLPDRYKNFPQGSVMPINLPIGEIMSTPKQSNIDIELPIGRFSVAHDDTVNESDGSKTWIGHLADEGEGYRVFLSQGPAGVMGIITTPDRKYSIEPEANGTTYLLDTSLLTSGGYEGDTKTHSH